MGGPNENELIGSVRDRDHKKHQKPLPVLGLEL